MNRLARFIEELPLQDLRLIKKDLEAGNIDRLVARRLAQLDERKICATCGRELSAGEQKYAIEFGPRDLRQKAWFDELDCLDHFLALQRARAAHVDDASEADQ
jgi:hypothetical protein